MGLLPLLFPLAAPTNGAMRLEKAALALALVSESKSVMCCGPSCETCEDNICKEMPGKCNDWQTPQEPKPKTVMCCGPSCEFCEDHICSEVQGKCKDWQTPQEPKPKTVM